MLQLNTIDKGRKTAIYVRISTGMQKTDRQVTELKNLVEEGVYPQILFSEFSRLDRKPSNLLKRYGSTLNTGLDSSDGTSRVRFILAPSPRLR